METEYGASPVQSIRVLEIDFKDLILTSIGFSKEIWIPGEVKRCACKMTRHHEITKPSLNCTCGIWACKSRKGLGKTFPFHVAVSQFPKELRGQYKCTRQYVSAQIQQWGIVIEHERGFRSEYARVIPETIQFWPRTFSRNRNLIQLLRRKYGAK
jgi:hypothetical protein